MLLKAFPSKQLPWSSSSVKKLLSYFLCRPIFAVNSWNTTKEPLSTYGLDFPLFFGWLLHVFSCIGNDDTKNGECFVTILCENWWNTENSHWFYTKRHSLPLTFSDNQVSERPELTGSKMALLFLPVCQNLEIHALHKFR